MKSLFFLALPLLATFGSLCFVILLNHVQILRAQEPVLFQAHRLVERRVDAFGEDCAFSLYDYTNSDPHKSTFSNHLAADGTGDDFGGDPMLQKMPGTDFQAYVRADIASFYQQAPGSMKEEIPVN
jgi:hypothetical protein